MTGPHGPAVPRIIYSLWLQGLGEAPEIVRLNLDRWARLNPRHRLEVLDRAGAQRLLAGLPLRLDGLPPQALSDVIRLRLLLETGGVWVDASVFPTRPLDDWLPSEITGTGFFAFEKPGPDRPICSWFLASTAENAMIRAWWKTLCDFWSTSRRFVPGIPADPVGSVTAEREFRYFWLHYLFRSLLERDAGFAAAWAHSGKLPADAPHLMQLCFARCPHLEPASISALASLAPLHKLDWRSPYPSAVLAALQ